MELKLKNITIEYNSFTKRSQYMELADHSQTIEQYAGNATKQSIELLKLLTSILVVRIETADETITDKSRFWDTIETISLVDDEDLGLYSNAIFTVLNDEYSKRADVNAELKKKSI